MNRSAPARREFKVTHIGMACQQQPIMVCIRYTVGRMSAAWSGTGRLLYLAATACLLAPMGGTDATAQAPAQEAAKPEGNHRQVELEFRFFAGPPDAINAALAAVNQQEDLSQFLTREKRLQLLSAPRITTLDGNSASVEMVRELVVPASYDLEIVTQESSTNRINKLMPTEFSIRHQGLTVQLTPTLQQNRGAGVRLNLMAEWVREPEFEKLACPPLPSNQAQHYSLLRLPASRLSSTIEVPPGQVVAAGVLYHEEKFFVKEGRFIKRRRDVRRPRPTLILVKSMEVDIAGKPVAIGPQAVPKLRALDVAIYAVTDLEPAEVEKEIQDPDALLHRAYILLQADETNRVFSGEEHWIPTNLKQRPGVDKEGRDADYFVPQSLGQEESGIHLAATLKRHAAPQRVELDVGITTWKGWRNPDTRPEAQFEREHFRKSLKFDKKRTLSVPLGKLPDGRQRLAILRLAK